MNGNRSAQLAGGNNWRRLFDSMSGRVLVGDLESAAFAGARKELIEMTRRRINCLVSAALVANGVWLASGIGLRKKSCCSPHLWEPSERWAARASRRFIFPVGDSRSTGRWRSKAWADTC